MTTALLATTKHAQDSSPRFVPPTARFRTGAGPGRYRGLFITGVLLASLFRPPISLAMPQIDVWLTATKGVGGLNKPTAISLYHASRNDFLRQGIADLRLIKFTWRKDICLKYRSLSHRSDLLNCWVKYYRKRSSSTKLIHFGLIPPLQEGGKLWLAGYASGVGSYRRFFGVGYSAAELVNQDGQQRLYHSQVCLSHELGHLLGAGHDSTNSNIMHPDAMAFASENTLFFNELAAQEINSVLKK